MLVFMLVFMWVSSTSAATLHFDPVEDTPDCTIAGYIAWWGAEEGVYTKNYNIGNVTEVENVEELFNLVPGESGFFVVNAYSDENQQGAFSNTAAYTYTVPPLPENNVGVDVDRKPGVVVITVTVPVPIQ